MHQFCPLWPGSSIIRVPLWWHCRFIRKSNGSKGYSSLDFKGIKDAHSHRLGGLPRVLSLLYLLDYCLREGRAKNENCISSINLEARHLLVWPDQHIRALLETWEGKPSYLEGYRREDRYGYHGFWHVLFGVIFRLLQGLVLQSHTIRLFPHNDCLLNAYWLLDAAWILVKP